MPVKGTVRVIPFENRIENLMVGKKGYVYIEDLIATRKGIFLDIETEVILEEDLEVDERFEVVPIKRLGTGFTDDDWELDLTELLDLFELESEGAYRYFMRNIGKYIHFSSAKLELADEDEEAIPILNVEPFEIEELNPLSEIDQLAQDLKDAEENQDYEKAAEIRDKLKEKNKT